MQEVYCAETRLAKELGLSPEERAVLLPSGTQTIFANRVHLAKTYLSKAGLLTVQSHCVSN
jgi:restriction system protein